MTWKEFKDLVDAQIKGNEEIMYIDISHPNPNSLEIEVNEDNDLEITG